MKRFVPIIAICISFTVGGALRAGNHPHYNLQNGVAIQGYDPVSYFQGRPSKGSKELSAQHEGVTYYFSTEANRNQFGGNQSKYKPAYGGWCSYSMVKGEKVNPDPQNFKLINGRVYLFFKSWLGNGRTEWDKDEPRNLATANARWQTLSGENP